jgi:uncharacterized membrane protein
VRGVTIREDASGPTTAPTRWRQRWVRRLGGVVVSGVVLVVILALPDLGPSTASAPLTAWQARIVALLEPHRPDPAQPGSGFLPDARVLLLEGPQAGREVDAYLQGPGGQQDASSYRIGEDVVVTFQQSSNAGPPFVAVQDRWRVPQLAWLLLAFALAVVLVGGWRGLRALVALALTGAVVVRLLVPLILQGIPPIPIAVVIATGITILTIWLTEGLSRAGVAAILGTAAALSFTALLAGIAISAAAVSGGVGEELIYLQTATGLGLDLRGLLLAAFMLGTIGVLDDVTVTQASAVEELATHAGLRGRRLFASALKIGQSHIAAIVNTLFLAYLGASLPLVILFAVSGQPTSLILNGEPIAIEIIRTLVGSLGIVAAVPFTTLVAVWLAAPGAGDRRAGLDPESPQPQPKPFPVLVGGLAVIGVATAAAAALLGPGLASPPRTALVPDQFGPAPAASPGSSVGSASSSPGPPGQGGPSAPSTAPPVRHLGDAIAVEDSGGMVGSITVLRVQAMPATSTEPGRLVAEIRYEAQRSMGVDPGAWVATSLAGGGGVGRPATTSPALEPRTLRPGEVVVGWVAFDVSSSPSETSLVFFGSESTPQFVVRLG